MDHSDNNDCLVAMATRRQKLDLPILKAFADVQMDVNEKMNFVLGRVENIVQNGKK